MDTILEKTPTSGSVCTAFSGAKQIASGARAHVALAVKRVVEADPWASVLVFNDANGERIELDVRGTDADVLARLMPSDSAPAFADIAAETSENQPTGPGRPKLGVVAREVTLLPRHWEWLAAQSGGASVVLRKLVEEARKASAGKDRVRQAQEAGYRFMSALAGNLPNFEEASRALFAGDRAQFTAQTQAWPPDIQAYAQKLTAPVWEGEPDK